jgi:integrase
MALQKRGKKGYYSAYFRTVQARPDGSLKYATVTVNLGTADLRTARALEAELMAKNTAARLHQRAEAHMIRLDIAAGIRPAEDAPVITRDKRRKRLLLGDGIATAEKYREVSADTRKIWRRFVESVSCQYFDEVTPEVALSYLQDKYGDPDKGKTFNNNRSALSGIFRFCLVDAGMSDNPFAVVPMRRFISEHQRPFSEEEFKRIHAAAKEPWKTAVLIAWHTGMRKETVFNLRWSNLDGDVITAMPGKTARFGRAVEIPLHPQVMQRLEQLPRVNDFVFGCFKVSRTTKDFRYYFGELLDQLGIYSGPDGIVNFNCFRDSFITRCDEYNVPRHATRGIVGQVSDDTTDLYSHDLVSARKIQNLPWVDLDNLN